MNDLISRQAAIDARRYTFGHDGFSLEAAYHDCKLLFDGITDDDSFQEADTGLLLYYANEIIYALHEALEGKDTNVPSKDTIYRQDVIELVKNSYYNLAESIEDTWAMVADVERLPSVETFKIGKTYPLDGYEIEIKKGECGNSFVTIKRPTKNVWRKNE